MERITSRTNPLLTHIRRLAASGSYRRQCGEYLGDSPKVLQEALLWKAELVCVVHTGAAELPPLPADVRVVEVPADIMTSVSPMKTPQGVLFTCRIPARALPEKLTGRRYAVLEGVQDPGNVGTVLRTLDAFDADGLFLLPGCADVYSPKTMRASMGAVFRRPVWSVTPEELGDLLRRSGIPLGAGGAETAARGAGVVNCMAFLRGALRVDAQTDAFTRRLCRWAELCQLAGRVEHDVVRVVQQLGELVCPVGGAEHMILFLRQFFSAQTALVQAAGLGARKVRGQHRVDVKVGERLLRQQNLAAGALLHAKQNLTIAAQLPFVQQVAGGGQGGQRFVRKLCQPQKGRAGVSQPHQSTRAGLWLSERGRPYLSRASRYGSGSNSSTVCTPLVVHLPVSSIRAPHIAGTPVV